MRSIEQHQKQLAIRQAYAVAKQRTRLEYARYLVKTREIGKTPKTFNEWLKSPN